MGSLEEGVKAAATPASGGGGSGLSAAERARAERNRLRARELRDARLAARGAAAVLPRATTAAPWDSGGGFLVEPSAPAPVKRAEQPPAPLQPPDRPECGDCGRRFASSYLLDTFDFPTCDECRDDEGAHELLTRTEAKTEFLLKDCDLDARPPPLRCVRRPNPHRGARSDMRLYLRAQVEARALEVWGSQEALAAERAARDERREQRGRRQGARRLKELRLAVRSSLYKRVDTTHTHRWGPETQLHEDSYERACLDCGHVQTYEKI